MNPEINIPDTPTSLFGDFSALGQMLVPTPVESNKATRTNNFSFLVGAEVVDDISWRVVMTCAVDTAKRRASQSTIAVSRMSQYRGRPDRSPGKRVSNIGHKFPK